MTGPTATKATLSRRQEKQLVARMLHGDEAAYREFVDLYKDRLMANMYAHLGCRHDAEEIVQEAFFKALKHLPRFRHQSQLYTWIYRIAWNASASRARKTPDEVSLEASGAGDHSSAPESFEPHVPMERRERVDALRRALSQIDPQHRQILILREFEELSYREIAAAMNVPLGTVRSRLARARERLRDQLMQQDAGEASSGESRVRTVPNGTAPDSPAPESPAPESTVATIVRVSSADDQDARLCEI